MNLTFWDIVVYGVGLLAVLAYAMFAKFDEDDK